MYEVMQCLRRVPEDQCVMVARDGGAEGDGGGQIRLCSGDAAVNCLRKLTLLMHQADRYSRRALNWRSVANSLQVVGVMRAHARHPVNAAKTRAEEVVFLLQELLRRSAGAGGGPAPAMGANRCAGQEDYRTVRIPNASLAAARDACGSSGRPFILLMLGQVSENGLLVTELMRPSVTVGRDDRVVLREPGVCIAHITRKQLQLLGVVFCRALPPFPLDVDVHEFAACAANSVGKHCTVLVALNSESQRFFTLPSQPQVQGPAVTKVALANVSSLWVGPLERVQQFN